VRTFYDELEITETASDERIRAAYRHLAQRLHPDKNPDPRAGERFRSIGAAYATLTDPETRVRYDLFLKRQRAARQRELARAKRAADAAARHAAPPPSAYASAPAFMPGAGAGVDGVAGKVGIVVLIALFGAASLIWQLL
jgi:DnaJ-class molecular chaperone